jgi:hypothetical protein
MGALAEFKRRLIERPARELAYMFAAYLLIDIPIRAAEETAISWIREGLASYLGIERPPLMLVFSFVWNWTLPLVGTILLMLAYHRGNLKRAAANVETEALPALDRSRTSERDSGFIPWLAVLVAIALFSVGVVTFNRQNAAGPQGLPGPQGAQGIPGPPGPSVSDPRVDALQHRLNVLARLAFLEGCQQRLGAAGDKFDEAAERAKKLIDGNGLGGPTARFIVLQAWESKLVELQTIAKQCVSPPIDSRLEPTDDEMHSKTGDEPPNTDPDLIYKFRKLNLKKARATALISTLSGTISSEIATLRNQAAPNIGQP